MMCKGVFLYLYRVFVLGGNTQVFTSGGMATRYPGNTPAVTWAVTHRYSPLGVWQHVTRVTPQRLHAW